MSNHTAGYVPAKVKEVTGNLCLDFAVVECRHRRRMIPDVRFCVGGRRDQPRRIKTAAGGRAAGGGFLADPFVCPFSLEKTEGEEGTIKRSTVGRFAAERRGWLAAWLSTPDWLPSCQS
jgi:hypothetical protein